MDEKLTDELIEAKTADKPKQQKPPATKEENTA
jgi:hypothetical protein